MADSDIKKVIIPRSDLPPVSGFLNNYVIRYRITSEQKHRFSSWSPQYGITVEDVPNLSTEKYSLVVNQSAKTISLVWTPPSDLPYTSFDIYVRWSGDSIVGQDPLISYPWQYAGTVSSAGYGAVIPAQVTLPSNAAVTTKHVQVAVQIPTYPKEYPGSIVSQPALLFETALTNV